MTIQEMHVAFKVGYDLIDTQGYVGMEPEELDLILNRSIERFVKTRYSGMNPKRESYEETQKRIDDLRTITVRNTISATNIGSTIAPHQADFTYALPAGGVGSDPKYMFLVGSTVFVDVDECGVPVNKDRRIKIKQVTHDQLEEYLDDPFHKPSYEECLVLFEGNTIFFFTGGLYTVKRFDMVYLTYPAKVSITTPTDCDLPEHTHQEIVDIAVRLSRGIVGDQNGLQTENQTIIEQE